ncbi:hypothetical protein [Mariluticola halotolerans]|uniref:hypothetical protein n=1 Tax=Mariluticola halotolerans TaxID=2909283 RepID=UPI0026E3AD69|nr:hypothetical protein [Mariluticola halotolerans]UJQ93748.1 hypothetical protein L1P08_12260 [Mariluticola halotolerans]
MSLERLAKELEETARQTSVMVEGITDALAVLAESRADADATRELVAQKIIVALQGQDRIEQRCRNMAEAVRHLVASDRNIDHARFDEIWAHLALDELAVPELSGIAGRTQSGEVDLF